MWCGVKYFDGEGTPNQHIKGNPEPPLNADFVVSGTIGVNFMAFCLPVNPGDLKSRDMLTLVYTSSLSKWDIWGFWAILWDPIPPI